MSLLTNNSTQKTSLKKTSQSTKQAPNITKLMSSAMFVAIFSTALTANNLLASNLVAGGGGAIIL
ncbi:hypothetical protein [Helicobacter macacae]|uniref:Uncharacterized protein n=1 Tax=Helicobacter macacae MIT 99-5501 TaxID=1357400 RepID=V8C973_9HELI|nr:hypothetical protein [Helicobacter macacae]ETD23909.1 hypothetical protein HMPREF2086_00655 [Helicobacter macacae MIT 99-5501]